MTSEERKFKVLVTNPDVPEAGLDVLRHGCDLTICENIVPKRSEILTKVKGVDGIFWATHEKLNAEILDAAGDQLKAISTMSAGLDQVDLPELKRRRIALGHTPTVLNEAVADIAVGLMIAAARRFHEGRIKIDTETWLTGRHQWMLGQDIKDATVGFVGFGGIGQAIAQRLKGFEIGTILYTSRKVNPQAKEFKAGYVKFDELLKNSDFVFVVCPLTEKTQGMFNEDAFNIMKPTSVLVNVARGQIVDKTALYNALKENKIFAAGLDVITPEPLSKDDPILTLPNCVITPHLGSATFETRENMAVIAAHNVVRGIAGIPMFSPAYEL